MSITLETRYTLRLDGAKPEKVWNIDPKNVRDINCDKYVKLRAYDTCFIRFLCAGFLELPQRTIVVLSEVEGWKKLRELRNTAAFEAPDPPKPSGLAALFGTAPTLTKKTRLSAQRIQDLRDEPEVFELDVPSANGDDISISVAKPAHPRDELLVRLDACTLEHVITYIRDNGLTLDMLLQRREYRKDAAEGMRNGKNSGLVQKRRRFEACSGYDDVRKWVAVVGKKRVHARDQDSNLSDGPLPVADGEEALGDMAAVDED